MTRDVWTEKLIKCLIRRVRQTIFGEKVFLRIAGTR